MLKLALIGCGGRSELALNFELPQLETSLVAIADIDENAMFRFQKNFREKHGKDLRTYLNYQAMLEQEHPDGVIILSPDYLHYEHAIFALKNHINCFLDKPLALQTKHCDNLIKLSTELKIKLMVGHNMRYMRFTRKIYDLIRAGVIGEVRNIWCRHFINYGGYAYFTRWMCEEDKVNSLLLQKGSHDIDIIHWFANSESCRVVGMGNLSVYNRCHRRNAKEPRPQDDIPPWPPLAKQNLNPKIDVNDHNMLLMTMRNGVQAALLECFYTPDSCRNYTIIGTEGRIENYGDTHGNPTVEVWNKRNLEQSFNIRGDLSYDVTPPIGSHGGSDTLIAIDFVRYLRGEKEPEVPIYSARAAVATGCAGAESMRKNSMPIDIPPFE